MSNLAKLRRVLTAECETYQSYLSALAEENKAISRFNSEKVEILTQKRQDLFERMRAYQDQRIAIVKEIAGDEKANLGTVISQKFSGRERRELEALRNKLRALVEKSRRKGFEFNQIVNFALNFVNGTISLLLSASQNIVKSYGRSGVIKESFNPAGNARSSGVSKEA